MAKINYYSSDTPTIKEGKLRVITYSRHHENVVGTDKEKRPEMLKERIKEYFVLDTDKERFFVRSLQEDTCIEIANLYENSVAIIIESNPFSSIGTKKEKKISVMQEYNKRFYSNNDAEYKSENKAVHHFLNIIEKIQLNKDMIFKITIVERDSPLLNTELQFRNLMLEALKDIDVQVDMVNISKEGTTGIVYCPKTKDKGAKLIINQFE